MGPILAGSTLGSGIGTLAQGGSFKDASEDGVLLVDLSAGSV